MISSSCHRIKVTVVWGKQLILLSEDDNEKMMLNRHKRFKNITARDNNVIFTSKC